MSYNRDHKRGFLYGYNYALDLMREGMTYEQLCDHERAVQDWRDGQTENIEKPEKSEQER